MVTFDFKDLEFIDDDENLRVLFLKHFEFNISKSDLDKIGKYELSKKSISFDSTEKKANKFYSYIDIGLNNLVNKITGKKTLYVHKNSGIPLVGNGTFGIIDRGSSLIEIKPVTGCNLDCVYCSVDENRRQIDVLIEKDYLIDELKKIVKIKKNPVEIHVGVQGEPLIYSPLVDLVKDLNQIDNVHKVSMNTNGLLLNETNITQLIDSGLLYFNLSINAMDNNLAKTMAGGAFSVNHIIRISKFINSKGGVVSFAPVWVSGMNDGGVEDIVKTGKDIGVKVNIQNFLKYKFGKSPGKELTMDKFYLKLEELEKKHDVRLKLCADDFDIKPDVSLEKPFKKNEVIQAEIVCDGRLPGEKIAVTKDRCISVYNTEKKGLVNLKITSTKHNIFAGIVV